MGHCDIIAAKGMSKGHVKNDSEDTCLIACRNCVDVIENENTLLQSEGVRFILGQLVVAQPQRRGRDAREVAAMKSFTIFVAFAAWLASCCSASSVRGRRMDDAVDMCVNLSSDRYGSYGHQTVAVSEKDFSRWLTRPKQGGRRGPVGVPRIHISLALSHCCLTPFVSAIETLVSIGAGTARSSITAAGSAEDCTEGGARCRSQGSWVRVHLFG